MPGNPPCKATRGRPVPSRRRLASDLLRLDSMNRWMLEYLLERLPTQSSIRGNWLYGWFGEALLKSRYWNPSRHSLALGVSAGWFIGLLPLFGLQSRLALLAGALLRCHLPAIVLGALVANPITLPAILALQYCFGRWLLDASGLDPLQGVTGPAWVLASAVPFLVGAAGTAALAGPAGYGITWLFWGRMTWRRLGKVV